MIQRLTFLCLLLALCFSTEVEAQKLKGLLNKAKEVVEGGGGLSKEEAGEGLKEALNIGVGEAVDFLSVEDGYYKSPYKILMPEEAEKVVGKLRAVPGFSNVEEDVLEKINRAAEDAATKAKPIFISAIKQMTFKDALNILMGEKNAATTYLEKATYDQLYNEFKPVIIASLDKFKARETWRGAVKAHNKLPFVKKANPELDDYVAKQALVGMFSLVEKKEADIRGNADARPSALLQKVFAQQDK
ncbi:MAG: DUF4197 domain-containing protein [Bacteroidota bacterium]